MHEPIAPPPRTSRRRWFLVVAAFAGVVPLIAAARCVVMVDQTEQVYITEFGRPVRLIAEPGLHFKWPHQSRRGFDRRLQLHAPPPREMLTRDKKNLEVAWFVAWKLDDVERFLRSVRTIPDASARLEDMAASVLASKIGGKDLAQLVQVGDSSALGALMDDVTGDLRRQAGEQYGVAVVDCRLKRLNYPEEVRSSVFEQIRSERRKVAATTRAEGEKEARIIRSDADLQRARLLADAESEAARTLGEGEAAATRIANAAHAADPSFYQFLKTLDTYRVALDQRTTLILSADSPFLHLLTQGLPEPGSMGRGPRSTASTTGATTTSAASHPGGETR